MVSRLNMNIKYNMLGILWWGERRELDGGCVVENRCVGRHVDNYKSPKFVFPFRTQIFFWSSNAILLLRARRDHHAPIDTVTASPRTAQPPNTSRLSDTSRDIVVLIHPPRSTSTSQKLLEPHARKPANFRDTRSALSINLAEPDTFLNDHPTA